MRIWKRAASVGLSLALCAGMVAPAFAQDAYFYVKIDADGEQPEITQEDKEAGKGYNTGADGTQWVFIGKGEVDPDKLEEGELSDAVTTPEEGEEQNFNTGHYFVDGQKRADVDATIETFHDIGKYEYYDGEGDVPEYSYTVTWETTSTADGFNFSSNECGVDGIDATKGPWSGYYEDHNIRVLLGEDAYHVDGTATLSTNPGVTVTVKMYGAEEAETVTNEDGEAVTKYVLKKDAENENKELADAAVQAAVANIAGGEDINLDNFTLEVKPVETEDGKTAYVGEYVEKTYTVTYTVTGAQNSTTDGGTYGKQSGGDTKDADLTGYSTGAGTYTFSAWEETVDDEGNITYTAVCTFTPYVFDFDTPDDEVEIDDVEVPLAGLFTRADAIGYLWQQAGEPEAELSDFEDVPEDHQWAVAIGWAQDMGIALPDLDGNFRPDDLVERFVEDAELKPEGELEEFLNRYAVYAGIELADGELFVELGGEADDIVMGEDAQVIFDDFFAKLEAALSQAA